MNEDDVKLQQALAAMHGENQALRQTEAKLHEEIAALRKSLSEMSTDVGAQARLLADCASQSLRASIDLLTAARAAGIPAVEGKAEIVEQLASRADTLAANLMAYMTYMDSAITRNEPPSSGRNPGA